MSQPAEEHSPRPEDVTPPAREVAPNIWKLTIPIPFPLRTVNIHVLSGRDGWALVDTGMGTPEARAAFESGLQQIGLHLKDLRAILLTHHHPDHIGLSGELHQITGAPVYMHPIDEASVQILYTGTLPERFGRVSHFFTQHGLPPTRLWLSQIDREASRRIINVPPHEAFTLVEDGQMIDLLGESYRVIWTPGHSDGQICLLRERDGAFFAADHVLPRITPNIGLYSEKDRPNPLSDYLDSLAKVARLPARLVLPGHGEPFNDLALRCAEIIEHHNQRLKQILTFLAKQPQHAAQLTEQLFNHRLKSDEARRMAFAEVLSHLEYLRYKGQVEQRRGENGIILYEVV